MEEKKIYPTAEVTITTEEYRDLITEAAENRKEAEIERGNRWKLEAEIKALKEELNSLKNVIESLHSENRKLVNELSRLEVELANYKEVCKNVCS